MLAKFIILENLAYKNALLSQYKTIAISFGKNWADIESRSKNKQMKMSKAQFQQMKSTEAVHIRLLHGI